jgi:hypothetical protein
MRADCAVASVSARPYFNSAQARTRLVAQATCRRARTWGKASVGTTDCRKIVLAKIVLWIILHGLSGVALLERRAAVRRILKALTYIAAGLYLLVDAIFMTIAKPIAKWIDKHVPVKRLRDWIRSLPPYPSLALFSVPVIVLEPIKPIAAYLAATGQFLSGAVTFIFGELLKLVLVERLFSLTREKLMRIPAFARLYQWYSQAIAWLKATDAWRTLESVARSAREYLRVTGMRAAQWIERRRNGHARRHLK